jgi:serine/threonine protein kinase
MSRVTEDLDLSDVPESIAQKGYEVIGLLGAGGFARVYLARKANVRVRYAIKVLRTEFARNPDDRRTFLEEAYKLHEIARDRVIAARDIHAAEGDIPWFAMDYAERGTLDAWVKKFVSHPELAQLVGLGVEICECLVDLHHYDIVHFDLKPHNILLRSLGESVDRRRGSRYRLPPDQRMVLGDLGLARTASEVYEQTGGTQQYIAPETFRAQGSERSDLFALGMMLYEFGHPDSIHGPVRPYEGRVPSSKPAIKRSLQEIEQWGPYQPLRVVRPDLPQELDDLVERLLAPDPNDRFHDAFETSQALDRLLQKRPRSRPSSGVVTKVDEILTEVRELVATRNASEETYDALQTAEERLRRQRPRIAVLPAGDVNSSRFTLYLAGEPESVEVPDPYGSVITYIRDGKPERAIVEGRLGEEFRAMLRRDSRHNLRASLHTESVRRLTLKLDHEALHGVEWVDVPSAVASDEASMQALSNSDVVIVVASDMTAAGDTLTRLRVVAQRSLAGPIGFMAVDSEPCDFEDEYTSTRALEDLGFQPALGIANAGLALRVLVAQMLDQSRGHLIAASGALALCDVACSRTNDWSIAKHFIDRRDEVEHEFPELRDLRYLREETRGDFELATEYARQLRRTLAQPTPAGKLDLPSDETDVPAIHRAAEERLFEWMTALADGSIPAGSAGAARVVVAALRRLQDVEEL